MKVPSVVTGCSVFGSTALMRHDVITWLACSCSRVAITLLSVFLVLVCFTEVSNLDDQVVMCLI